MYFKNSEELKYQKSITLYEVLKNDPKDHF